MNAVKDSAALLTAAAKRMREWRLDERDTAALRKGFKRTYRRALQAFAIARAKPTPENLHEWRKQVKYLEQSLQVWKSMGNGRPKARIERADKLAELLGTDHDLFVFALRLKELDAAASARPYISRTIAARRRKLRRKALRNGRTLFAMKPRGFLRNVLPRR